MRSVVEDKGRKGGKGAKALSKLVKKRENEAHFRTELMLAAFQEVWLCGVATSGCYTCGCGATVITWVAVLARSRRNLARKEEQSCSAAATPSPGPGT